LSDTPDLALPLAPELAAPFVHALEETFEKMMSCSVSLVRDRELPIERDISAVVGFAGARRGVAILSFAEGTACRVVSRFAGDFQEELNAVVYDGVAELLNIVAGRAKGALAKKSGSIDMSLPTVVAGHDYELHRHKDAPQVLLSFSSELGDFELLLFLEREPGPPARVLVVDDSRVMRKLVRAALKDFSPPNGVIEAENLARAREALAAAKYTFDLVVLDLHMPDGNGVAILEEIRQDRRGLKVPVIVVTSDPDVETIVSGVGGRFGGADLTRALQKPFAPAELVRIAQSFRK
jgi:chemotaxis protein CheX